MAMEFSNMTVFELRAALENGETTSEAIVQAAYARIDETQPQVNALIQDLRSQALDQARAADQRRSQGEGGLCGIPFAIKDNLCTKGLPTTCASKMLSGFCPPYTAHVLEKLEQAGTVCLGKTNLDEFAMGSSTESSLFGPTHNPCDLSRVAGGSSGGSAAAVAAGMVPFALGSDTGGSVRQPAAFCGVVGFKPSYGTLSRYGLISYASSLDQVGVFARTAQDCALVMDAMAGYDDKDATSNPDAPTGFEAALIGDLKGLRIGLPSEYFESGIDVGIRKSVEQAAAQLEAAGAIVSPRSLPRAKYALPAYYLLASAEASSNLARFDGVRYGYRAPDCEDWESLMEQSRTQAFGDEVKRRIMLGTFVLSAGYYDAYYKKAQQVRTLILEDYDRAFEQFDLLLTPTTPVTAWKLGDNADPLAMYAADICTVAVNIAGLPAISLPCGKDADGLPIGMQLIGAYGQDKAVIAAAHLAQQVMGNRQGGAK